MKSDLKIKCKAEIVNSDKKSYKVISTKAGEKTPGHFEANNEALAD